MAASPVAGVTAGDLRTSVCRVVIYLRKDMSGASALHAPQSLDDPPPARPKTKATCTTGRAAVGPGNKYVRLNVGGTLFYTTLEVLTRQDSVLRAMFSGKQEVFTDREGGSPSLLKENILNVSESILIILVCAYRNQEIKKVKLCVEINFRMKI